MITLEHVAQSYGKTAILADVSMQVKRGEIICLYGPSGCGKTTIIDLISGLLKPNAGYVRVNTCRVGYAFQDDRLVPWLTVEDNLLLSLSGYFNRIEAKDLTRQWLEVLELTAARNAKPSALSGGMKRRLNLARSLAIEPDLLLLDEPFAFLDKRAVKIIQNKILELHRDRSTTIILVSHVPDHAAALEPQLIKIKGTPIRLTYC